MEPIVELPSIDAARNKAIEWLEDQGAIFDQNREIVIGRLGAFEGSETGVQSSIGTFWRIRLDYDPVKGAHYNAEYDTGAQRRKHAFAFPSSAEVIARLARQRRPR